MRRHPKLIGAFVVVAAVFLLGLFFLRASQTGASDERICAEVETVKKAHRTEAWQQFNDLDKNLELLGIRKTPEIVDAAKASRDNKLKLYAKTDCGDLPSS